MRTFSLISAMVAKRLLSYFALTAVTNMALICWKISEIGLFQVKGVFKLLDEASLEESESCVTFSFFSLLIHFLLFSLTSRLLGACATLNAVKFILTFSILL